MGNKYSASPIRLLGKIRSIQKDAKEITYEHTPPIKDLIDEIRKIVDQHDKDIPKTIKKIDKVLSKSYVDLIEQGSVIPATGDNIQRYKDILNPDKDLEYFRESRPAEKDATLSEDFNEIIENKTGIAADKVYKKAKAEVEVLVKVNGNFLFHQGLKIL